MTLLNPIAHQIDGLKKTIKAYMIASRILFIVGLVLLFLAVNEPVNWEIFVGVYSLIRGAVFEVKRDILVMKRDDLLNQL